MPSEQKRPYTYSITLYIIALLRNRIIHSSELLVCVCYVNVNEWVSLLKVVKDTVSNKREQNSPFMAQAPLQRWTPPYTVSSKMKPIAQPCISLIY